MKLESIDIKLLMVSFNQGVFFGFTWAVLGPYLKTLGYSGLIFGILGGTSVLFSSISIILAGILSDLKDSKIVLVLGTVLYSIVFLLLYIPNLPILLAAYVLQGLANGLLMTSLDVYTSRIGRDEVLHYAFSYVRSAMSFGGALGSFMGWIPILLTTKFSEDIVHAYRNSFIIMFFLALVNIIISLKLRKLNAENVYGLERKFVLRKIFALRELGRFYGIIVTSVLIGLGAAMSIHNISYYFAAKYNVTSGEIGSIFGLQQLTMALIMIKLPNIADKYGGPLKTYLLITMPSIPLLLAMTTVSNYSIASTIYLVRSILMNVANPLYTAFALSLVPRDKRGIATSMLNLSSQIPTGIGRAIGGWLLDIDLELPLRITALLYSISLGFLAICFNDYLKRKY
ncbi:MAG: MFS transporter [Staphylothermus sp.]|nr:MFS transporter [Staphylothermus sp.]